MQLYEEFVRRHVNIIISRLKKKPLEEFEQKNIFITLLLQSSFKQVDLVQ